MSGSGTLYRREGARWIRWDAAGPDPNPHVNALPCCLIAAAACRLAPIAASSNSALPSLRRASPAIPFAPLHLHARGRIRAGGPMGLYRLDGEAEPG